MKGGWTFMKIRLLLAGCFGIVMGMGVVRLGQGYRKWKREQVTRLGSESQLLETERGRVEYQVEGEGPAVLLLHGSPGGYDHGIALARFIPLDGFTTLAVSRPGYRRTPLSSGESPQAQADLCAATLDALHISRVAVIALSGGGPAGLQFALRYPDRCEKLIMLSAVSQKYSEEAVYQALPPVQRLLKRLFERVVAFDPCLYLASSLLSQSPQSVSASALISTLVMNNTSTDGYRNDMHQFAAMDDFPPRGIGQPTLIIHGTMDADVPFGHAETLARELADGRLLTVAGGRHSTTLNGQETRNAMRVFIASSQSVDNDVI
jgi:pimeloyl-ACP methyl ester carboxylesterase